MENVKKIKLAPSEPSIYQSLQIARKPLYVTIDVSVLI